MGDHTSTDHDQLWRSVYDLCSWCLCIVTHLKLDEFPFYELCTLVRHWDIQGVKVKGVVQVSAWSYRE